jgi:hypothetical protein
MRGQTVRGSLRVSVDDDDYISGHNQKYAILETAAMDIEVAIMQALPV